MLTCAELFAGGGVAGCGLKAAGYTSVAAVEYDEAIASVFSLNHGKHVTCARVQDVDYRPWSGVDFLWASPVCTNASVANANAGETAEDQDAARAVCRAIRECRPPRFALENVQGYAGFVSFGLIVGELRELGYAVEWGVLNSADYGVPQTRKRLILRAMLGVKRLPPLKPTHAAPRPCGGLLDVEPTLAPWRGWYGAVADLLPGLPDSAFAPWQIERLGKMDIAGDFLADCVHRTGAPLTTREADEPSWTITGSLGRRESNLPRAFLCQLQAGARGDWRADDEPAKTVSSQDAASQRLALLVHGTSTMETRAAEEPSAAVMATVHAKAAAPRALLVSNAATEWSSGIREAQDPVLSTTAEQGGRLRALLERGRVVSLSARCLGRFQTLPDHYRLPDKASLAYRIVGNGCPSLLAQRIAESMQ